MRSLSLAAQALLTNSKGLEPINLVQVFWDANYPTLYADRNFPGTQIVGKLLELSNLEDVVNVAKAANTSSITVKLDDSDGSIKAIFDVIDIIKLTVYVYQWFTELPLTDAFVIFEGEISSPIAWKEGERSFTFDVLSKIEDLQYGFSADEGNFEYIPQGLVGQAWPLTFGTVFMVPALQMYPLPTGLLQNSTATASSNANNSARLTSLLNSYYAAFNNWQECIDKALYCLEQSQTLQGDGVPVTQVYVLPSLSAFPQIAVTASDQWDLKAQGYNDQALKYRDQYMNIERELANLNTKPPGTNQLTVQNGGTFPQGTPTDIQIGSTTYTGQFSGNLFTVLSSSNPFATDGTLLSGPLTINDSDAATQYQANLNEQNFFYAIAGSAAIASGALSYIVSLFECNVVGVYAQYNGLTTAVPSTLYTISYQNFGPIQSTTITFPKALSLVDKLWSDSVFTEITSPVGPDIVEILKWLILNYTYHTYDPYSFGVVQGQISQYIGNFSLTSQGNIVKLLQEIAFQARCAIFYKQGIFYLKFLADMSTYVAVLTEDDVEFGTMEVSCTPTEELVTKYTATYEIANNLPGSDEVIWYYNMQKYGLLEKTDPYFIYNIPDLVQRASMFWLVRYTNTWKRLKFSTFLSHLAIETFDYVLVNFAHPWVSNAPVVGMVESALFDSANNRIELTIWLPIRFGEMDVYPFAAPYAISPTLVFPENYEQAGAQNNNTTSPGQLVPNNMTNKAGYNPTNGAGGSGMNPSDTGYSAPAFDSGLDPSTFNNTVTNPGTTASNQYVVKPVQNPDLSFDAPGVFPGIVQTRKSGNFYNVDVYFSGLSGTPTSTVVQQIRINSNDVIPPGSPCHVNRCRILTNTDKRTGLQTFRPDYTMQVPVFLKTPTSSGGGGPDPSAPTDPGGPPPDTGAGDFGGAAGANSGDEPLGGGAGDF